MNEKKSAAELTAKAKPECGLTDQQVQEALAEKAEADKVAASVAESTLTKDQAETLLDVVENGLHGAERVDCEPDRWECAEALCLAAQGRTGMALRVLAEDSLRIAAAGNSDLPESKLAALRAGLPEWKAREKRERGL